MAAYFVVDLEIFDADLMRDYRERVPDVIRKYGGRYLVRGGKFESMEGSWTPKRLVLLEFPNMEQAKRFYDCEEYRELKAVRMKAARTNLVLVEGVDQT
jgi:uncharacterized protein (DUF1330 family)